MFDVFASFHGIIDLPIAQPDSYAVATEVAAFQVLFERKVGVGRDDKILVPPDFSLTRNILTGKGDIIGFSLGVERDDPEAFADLVDFTVLLKTINDLVDSKMSDQNIDPLIFSTSQDLVTHIAADDVNVFPEVLDEERLVSKIHLECHRPLLYIFPQQDCQIHLFNVSISKSVLMFFRLIRLYDIKNTLSFPSEETL